MEPIAVIPPTKEVNPPPIALAETSEMPDTISNKVKLFYCSF